DTESIAIGNGKLDRTDMTKGWIVH
ncbi:MAG: hypothetical protein QG623_5, partial [Patescibacteria group bacterium]|nr:hypothetical protein [Patescibacteria group bacterium]